MLIYFGIILIIIFDSGCFHPPELKARDSEMVVKLVHVSTGQSQSGLHFATQLFVLSAINNTT